MLNVLNSFSDITALIQEVRKLEQKVLKMGKVLRKHGLVEDAKEVNVPRSFVGGNIDLSLPLISTSSTATSYLITSIANSTTSTTLIDEIQENDNFCPDDWTIIGSGCYQIHFDE